ncbi:MAG TPA: hypothetical protein VK875_02045 [Euzebyales bacterium]|nr:hypothetical protein [Euzebyales bacterium]
MVTDVDDRIDGLLQPQAGAGRAHTGLVEHHDHLARQRADAVGDLDQKPVDGCAAGDAGGLRKLCAAVAT